MITSTCSHNGGRRQRKQLDDQLQKTHRPRSQRESEPSIALLKHRTIVLKRAPEDQVTKTTTITATCSHNGGRRQRAALDDQLQKTHRPRSQRESEPSIALLKHRTIVLKRAPEDQVTKTTNNIDLFTQWWPSPEKQLDDQLQKTHRPQSQRGSSARLNEASERCQLPLSRASVRLVANQNERQQVSSASQLAGKGQVRMRSSAAEGKRSKFGSFSPSSNSHVTRRRTFKSVYLPSICPSPPSARA